MMNREMNRLLSSMLLIAVVFVGCILTSCQRTRQAAAKTPPSAHDLANPPIDCPLRKQGIDPAHMRPFEDVEKYIAFLERADRTVWQKPDNVIAALGLQGTETVMDLGAGSGYFAFRFAKALPRGKVIAADIEPEMIRHIHHKAMTESVRNLEAMIIQPTDPEVPDGVDLVFVCDVLHHVADRPAWLAKITKAMRSGASLVLVEFKEGDLPEGPPESVKIPHDELVALVNKAGLVLTAEQADLLPYQTFLVFQKP
jgi:SAM-dependent methyltransferase